MWVTSCHHGAARHTDVGGLMVTTLSLPGCWLLPLPPAAGRWLYVPFLQLMLIIIIIVIQHHRIKDIFVSTVVILLLKSNFININPTQLNYDSVIKFYLEIIAVPSPPFIGAPYLLVASTTYNLQDCITGEV